MTAPAKIAVVSKGGDYFRFEFFVWSDTIIIIVNVVFWDRKSRYELGDISIHTTSVFHAAGPNTHTQTRMIVGSTYFKDGT